MYINKKLHTSSRFARLRAVSKLSTFFYTPCIYIYIYTHIYIYIYIYIYIDIYIYIYIIYIYKQET